MPNDLSVTEKLAAHTPGPWSVERSIAGKTVITGPGGAHTLAVINITFDGAGGLSSLDANARLIAAAPDLLAAAKDAYIALPMAKRNEAINAALAAAIGKAEGRPW